MQYSIKQGVVKGVKYGLIFLVAGLVIGVSPEVKELTVGGLLVLLLNFLKVRFDVKFL